jgi:hypothetical protein
MPTEMLEVDALTPPEGMDALGVLRVLADRGDVVIVLEDDEETVSGFYEANAGEHEDMLKVPPEFRWQLAAKLGMFRMRNKGQSAKRELNLEDVLPAHLRAPVPDLADMLEGGGEDAR